MVAQSWLTPANWITAVRIALTPVVIAMIVRGRHREAALWFAIAAITDFFDGWFARAYHEVTRAGQYFDPVADKVLLSGVFLALAVQGSVPTWYVVLVFGRDLAILAASAIAMRVSTYRDYTPTVWGKISTALQILAAVSAMASNAEGSVSLRDFARAAIWMSAAATLWSAIHYTWRGVNYFLKRPGTNVNAK